MIRGKPKGRPRKSALADSDSDEGDGTGSAVASVARPSAPAHRGLGVSSRPAASSSRPPASGEGAASVAADKAAGSGASSSNGAPSHSRGAEVAAGRPKPAPSMLSFEAEEDAAKPLKHSHKFSGLRRMEAPIPTPTVDTTPSSSSLYSAENLQALRAQQKVIVKATTAPAESQDQVVGDADVDVDVGGPGVLESKRGEQPPMNAVRGGRTTPPRSPLERLTPSPTPAGVLSLPPTALPADGVKAVPSLDVLMNRLQSTIESANNTVQHHYGQYARLQVEASEVEQTTGRLQNQVDVASIKHDFFQELRRYVDDLTGCLHEKQPLINDLDKAMAEARTSACTARMRRRMVDTLDSIDMAVTNGGIMVTVGGTMPAAALRSQCQRDLPARVTAAMARQCTSCPAGIMDAGRLSDEDASDTEISDFKAAYDKLSAADTYIFSDVKPQFTSVQHVTGQMLKWRRFYPDSYIEAHASLSILDVLRCLVQYHLLRWNPLQAKQLSLESMPWFDALLTFGNPCDAPLDTPRERLEQVMRLAQKAAAEDEATIPKLVEHAVVPKLIAAIRYQWDAFSFRETRCLTNAFKEIAEYDLSHKALSSIGEAVKGRVAECLQMICVPVLLTREEHIARISCAQFSRLLKFIENIRAWEVMESLQSWIRDFVGKHVIRLAEPLLGILNTKMVLPHNAGIVCQLWPMLLQVVNPAWVEGDDEYEHLRGLATPLAIAAPALSISDTERHRLLESLRQARVAD